MAGNGEAPKDRPHQIRGLIHQAARLLEVQGASYRDVVRTWFYLDDILAWYPEFNRARTAVYGEFGLLPENGRLAATGQHRHSRARRPREPPPPSICWRWSGPPEGRPLVRQLRSPAQPEALTYGSAFSRGALIREPKISLIQVSGTAAIDEQGASLYPGDIRSQIDCTFDKIAALIGQEGASLKDIGRGLRSSSSPPRTP